MITGILIKIKEQRKRLGLTQEQIASYLGMKTSTYSDIEKGISRIRLEDFLLVCKRLNLDPSLLLKNDDKIIISLSKEQAHLIKLLNDQIENDFKGKYK